MKNNNNNIAAVRALMQKPGYPLDTELSLDINEQAKRPSLLIPVMPVDDNRPASQIPVEAKAALAVAAALGGKTTIYVTDTVPHHSIAPNEMRDAGHELAARYTKLVHDLGLDNRTRVVTGTELATENERGRAQAARHIDRMVETGQRDKANQMQDIANMAHIAADLSYLQGTGNGYELSASINNGNTGMPITPRKMKLLREFRAADNGIVAPMIDLTPGVRMGGRGMQDANLLAMVAGDLGRVPLDQNPKTMDARLNNVMVPVGYLTREIGHQGRAQEYALNHVRERVGLITSISNEVFGHRAAPEAAKADAHHEPATIIPAINTKKATAEQRLAA